MAVKINYIHPWIIKSKNENELNDNGSCGFSLGYAILWILFVCGKFYQLNSAVARFKYSVKNSETSWSDRKFEYCKFNGENIALDYLKKLISTGRKFLFWAGNFFVFLERTFFPFVLPSTVIAPPFYSQQFICLPF